MVFLVAAVAEKAGTFVNWGSDEAGRSARRCASPQGAHRTCTLLGAIADQMDVHLGLPDAAAARAELAALAPGAARVPSRPLRRFQFRRRAAGPSALKGSGLLDVRLATWHQLLDSGRPKTVSRRPRG